MSLKKIKGWIIKISHHPGWSNVISAGIIFIIATLWAKYNKYSVKEIFDFIIYLGNYRLPISIFISIFGMYFLLKKIKQLIKPRPDPIWDIPIGNFTFKELCIILQNQNFPVTTVGMQYSGRKAPNENLLYLFELYITYLNMGVKLEDTKTDSGYLFGVLAPKLLSYGIVEKIEVKHDELDIMENKYQTSELGHKFYSLLEKTKYLRKNN